MYKAYLVKDGWDEEDWIIQFKEPDSYKTYREIVWQFVDETPSFLTGSES